MDQNIKKKISEDFGLTKMDSDEQEKYIEKIGNLLFEAVIQRSVDFMDEITLNEFDKTIETAGEDYQKVIGFMKEKVPNFNKIVSEEMMRLKRTTAGIFS